MYLWTDPPLSPHILESPVSNTLKQAAQSLRFDPRRLGEPLLDKAREEQYT